MSKHSKTVTLGVTHGLPRYAQKRRDSAPRNPRHKTKYHASPYLMRRGRIFYFRNRLSTHLSNPTSSQLVYRRTVIGELHAPPSLTGESVTLTTVPEKAHGFADVQSLLNWYLPIMHIDADLH